MNQRDDPVDLNQNAYDAKAAAEQLHAELRKTEAEASRVAALQVQLAQRLAQDILDVERQAAGVAESLGRQRLSQEQTNAQSLIELYQKASKERMLSAAAATDSERGGFLESVQAANQLTKSLQQLAAQRAEVQQIGQLPLRNALLPGKTATASGDANGVDLSLEGLLNQLDLTLRIAGHDRVVAAEEMKRPVRRLGLRGSDEFATGTSEPRGDHRGALLSNLPRGTVEISGLARRFGMLESATDTQGSDAATSILEAIRGMRDVDEKKSSSLDRAGILPDMSNSRSELFQRELALQRLDSSSLTKGIFGKSVTQEEINALIQPRASGGRMGQLDYPGQVVGSSTAHRTAQDEFGDAGNQTSSVQPRKSSSLAAPIKALVSASVAAFLEQTVGVLTRATLFDSSATDSLDTPLDPALSLGSAPEATSISIDTRMGSILGRRDNAMGIGATGPTLGDGAEISESKFMTQSIERAAPAARDLSREQLEELRKGNQLKQQALQRPLPAEPRGGRPSVVR